MALAATSVLPASTSTQALVRLAVVAISLLLEPRSANRVRLVGTLLSHHRIFARCVQQALTLPWGRLTAQIARPTLSLRPRAPLPVSHAAVRMRMALPPAVPIVLAVVVAIFTMQVHLLAALCHQGFIMRGAGRYITVVVRDNTLPLPNRIASLARTTIIRFPGQAACSARAAPSAIQAQQHATCARRALT